MTDFNLSSKICKQDGYMDALETKDVKEFIRLLKDTGHLKNCDGCMNIMNKIDKLAGEELI